MQKSLGWIMLLVGMSLLLVGFMFPMATVIYATPTLAITPSYPAGTQSQPTPLEEGQHTLEAYVTMVDVGSLTVQYVDISGTDFQQTLPLTWTHQAPSWAYPKGYDKISAVWPAPWLPWEILLTFKWHIETSTGAKVDAYSYGKVVGPVGQFYINGQPATIDSVFTVTSPTLAFSFKATLMGDVIESVYVQVKCDSPVLDQKVPLTETTADTEWTGTYTLPSRGTYTLLGYFTYAGKDYRLMSVIGNFDVGATLPQFNSLAILGLASAGIGLVLIFTGKKH